MPRKEITFPNFYKTLMNLLEGALAQEQTQEKEDEVTRVFYYRISGFMSCLTTLIEEEIFCLHILEKIKLDIDNIHTEFEKKKRNKRIHFSKKQQTLFNTLSNLLLKLDLYCKNRR